MRKALILLVFLAFAAGLCAQMPVEIVNRAEDGNGRMLVTKFRDLIRGSRAYDLVYDDESAHFVVDISTMDRYKGDSEWEGVSTIYNYMILMKVPDGYSIYCYSQLGFTGSSTLDDTAYQIYSDLDEFVEALKDLIDY